MKSGQRGEERGPGLERDKLELPHGPQGAANP
jgi:hypothetical protein